MCLCNIDNPAEFMNTISNEDDKATPEGMAALDADLEKMHAENREKMIAALKLAIFDALVFELHNNTFGRGGYVHGDTKKLLAYAEALQRGELP